jgi:hypothetical protein
MFESWKSLACSKVAILRRTAKWGPIGVDISDDNLKLVQLGNNGDGMTLIASGSENRPDDVRPGSGDWQRWAIETIRRLTANSDFRGRDATAAMPASEVFIDHIRMPGKNDRKMEDAIFSKIKQKLPFEPIRNNVMIKYIPTEANNILVMATERKIIDRHLAMYEEAGLVIKSIGVWPVALTNCYARFFGTLESDTETIVMLICIETNCMNVVICHHKNPLFARSILIGNKQLDDENAVTRLVLELSACRRQFGSMYQNAQIERLIFLSSQAADRDVCATIAKQLEMPAQMGDCLAAVKIADGSGCSILDTRYSQDEGRESSIENRESSMGQVNWATAFGLSLQ